LNSFAAKVEKTTRRPNSPVASIEAWDDPMDVDAPPAQPTSIPSAPNIPEKNSRENPKSAVVDGNFPKMAGAAVRPANSKTKGISTSEPVPSLRIPGKRNREEPSSVANGDESAPKRATPNPIPDNNIVPKKPPPVGQGKFVRKRPPADPLLRPQRRN